MVDKCPNCGQPGRPGARFCTSCGFRLPERPVEPEPSPLSRSPFATTSTVAASWWPSSTSSDNQPEPTTDAPASETAVAAQEAPQGAAPDASSDDAALAPALEPEAAATVSSSDTGPLAGDLDAGEKPVEPAPFPAWPSFPSYGSNSTEPSSGWDSPAAGVAEAPRTAEPEDLAAAVDQLAGIAPAEEVAAEPPATESVEPPVSISEEFEAPPPFEPPAASAAPPAAETVAFHGAADDGALGRALALLDELRTLLPSLSGPAVAAPAAPTVDLVGIAEDLEQARDDALVPQPQLDALMTVVETAKERPRDIDVMLDLSRHVDAIAALKSGYDRCLAAIDETLSRLKSG